MSKRGKVYVLTEFMEYLYSQGIQSEATYLGDASRFIRFLMARATQEDLQSFLDETSPKKSSQRRTRESLRKFYSFAHDALGLETDLIGPS